jgi:hypothetical protein
MLLSNMDRWKIADITISSIQLLAVSLLTYSHRLKNHECTRSLLTPNSKRICISSPLYWEESGNAFDPERILSAMSKIEGHCPVLSKWITN